MILLTGGAGYIGSHVCMALLEAGFDVVVVDNLSNSNKTSLERVKSICGRSLVFRHADIRDEEAIYDAVESGNGTVARTLVLVVSAVALVILTLANRLSPSRI